MLEGTHISFRAVTELGICITYIFKPRCQQWLSRSAVR